VFEKVRTGRKMPGLSRQHLTDVPVVQREPNLAPEGGAHNPAAPPLDFLTKSYLPLVNRLGPAVEARLLRPGFYQRVPANVADC
jgi:RNA 3'-terminal phosphate cyclase